MLNFLCETSPVLKIVIDVLGVVGILVFGIFVMVFVVDLILSSSNDKEGVFFNKPKKERNKNNAVTYDPTPVTEPVNEVVNGVAYYPGEPVKEQMAEQASALPTEDFVQPVDFDKAIEEQKELARKNEQVEDDMPINNLFDSDDNEEDIIPIIEEVKAQALKELDENSEKEEKPARRIFKIKTTEPAEEQVDENIEIVENDAQKQESEDLARKLAELEELRKQDHEELLNAMQALKEKEPVIVEVDKSKEEEEKRRFANIARMNARLNSIKRNTDKLEKKSQKDKTPQTIKTVIVEEEIINQNEETVDASPVEEVVIETPVKVVEVEKTIEKPKFKKSYYENRLSILEQELKEAEKELKANNKEFAPLTKVKKAYERDSEKLRRKELVVAKQKVALYGVGNSSKKINPAKKEKLDENVKILKQLKDSVFNCEKVIEQNKDRFPILEKNNKLLNKQIKRLKDDIASVNEAIDWYNNNSEE